MTNLSFHKKFRHKSQAKNRNDTKDLRKLTSFDDYNTVNEKSRNMFKRSSKLNSLDPPLNSSNIDSR